MMPLDYGCKSASLRTHAKVPEPANAQDAGLQPYRGYVSLRGMRTFLRVAPWAAMSAVMAVMHDWMDPVTATQ